MRLVENAVAVFDEPASEPIAVVAR
jgi:hypothetical protein